jgi:PKD repeat protein
VKFSFLSSISALILLLPGKPGAQTNFVSPSIVITAIYLGESVPLRDLPALTDTEWQQMKEKASQEELNPELAGRSYPFAANALPKGPDPVWQSAMSADREIRAPIINFEGQTSPYYPPDANGTTGPNYYMQTINTVYAIYTKSGTLVAGPTAINTLFSGVPGSECNNGDPIVLYDEQADRWLVAEFSLCGATDYMLIAVSTTNDPTGTWHKYSFDVDDMPDYEKFGIWRDGYYMGTNNYSGNDIYVFERSQMLSGGSAQMVGFNNPWRPSTIDGFMCVPPLDNDGDFAPTGEPGLFIAFNDDAIGGGSDQLWIYELAVDWTTPSNSTFTRIQQIDVAQFDSNFGPDWNNISQLGTSQELDAIPQVIMNPPQYRNFGSYETILCCHTVDVDNTDHAGIRWYELRKPANGDWSIRQQGTFAPDEHSRWMGSIMLNGINKIGLGYSVSSSSIYPGIRYCGQSAAAYNAATGILDAGEEIIQTGINYQTVYNRWGDYSALQVDPVDDSTFWFTSEYIGSNGARRTKIASFQIGWVPLTANFSSSTVTPLPGEMVTFSDLSTAGPVSWSWSFSPNTVTYYNGTSSSSRSPQVSFDTTAYYTVSLSVSDGSAFDTEIKSNYIHAYFSGLWTGTASSNWSLPANWDGSVLPATPTTVTISSIAVNWPVFTGDMTLGINCGNLCLSGASQMTITGSITINAYINLSFTGNGILSVGGNWTNNGTFIPGAGTIEFIGTSPATVFTPGNSSDITSYQRSAFTKGMTALTGATTGPTGDDGYQDVPIGFTFKYIGTNYIQARLSTNGWLSLNQTGNSGYQNLSLFDNTLPNATVAPWWDDLIDDGSSIVSYKTEGTEPNRIFTAEWLHVPAYFQNATTRISFQVKLYETIDVIEFHYGNSEAGTHDAGESASIGIEDQSGGSGHFIEATTGSTTTGITSLTCTTNWPTENYRFSPPPPESVFQNIIINKNGSYIDFNSITVVNSTFNVMPGASFKVKNGKTLTVQGVAVF